MTATIIPFPKPMPATIDSECPFCGRTETREQVDCIGIPVVTCRCGCQFFGTLDDEVA